MNHGRVQDWKALNVIGDFIMKTEQLYYGVAYYDEYMPYDRVEKDMEMIAAAGMTQLLFCLIPGTGIVQTFLKIIMCSIAANTVFLFALSKTPEFQKLKHYCLIFWRRKHQS